MTNLFVRLVASAQCGRLTNARMGYSMDRKEVNSCNFTVKNLDMPSEVCVGGCEIVSRLVDHLRTI